MRAMDCGSASTAACAICEEGSFNAGARQMDCRGIPFARFIRTLMECCGSGRMMRAWAGSQTGALPALQLAKDYSITEYFRSWKIQKATSGWAAIGGFIESVSRS